MNDIACILCHTTEHPIAIKENGYVGKKCFDCNMIYISPRPSMQQIMNLYGHDEAFIPASNHIHQAYPKRLHARQALTVIKNYCTTGDLLEIGSGAGYFLDEAQRVGFKVHGIELNPVQCQFIRTHLNMPCSDEPLSNDSFGNQRFNVLYHSDVASHFYDPVESFNAMNAKLKDDGFLIFETGNLGEVNPTYYPLFEAFQYPDHLFFFGEKSINQLLEKSGFKLVVCHKYSIVMQLYIAQLVRKLRKGSAPISSAKISRRSVQSPEPNAVNIILKKMYHSLMNMIRYKVGPFLAKSGCPQTMIIVAQKK